MARELSEQLVKLISQIDKELAKAAPKDVVSVDWLNEEDVDSLYLKYANEKREGRYDTTYEVRKGQIINGRTLDSSYCIHIRRKE